ncbi:MAG: Gfo/Idh/MocA family oxidoreductase [Candidatus Omnitrophica bacterium]|nr:Gfo/Idh/MocA family oxidoreductase [Candidatus Omnitrophota bacterium]MCM8802889.1 Gfo/Idh/MocA family oxidoreductase [Candidatus Omnitrophota bacterium]
MLKIGFIGTGGISHRHLNNLKEIEGVKIVSAIEPNEENFKKFELSYGEKIKRYTDEKEMIEKEKLDGVVICSPHTFHFSQIKIALENGVDVLVEKPAVVTYDEAVEIRKIMEKTGKKVVVAYQRHYMPIFNGAKKILKERFGNIIFLSGFLSQYYYEPLSIRRPWRIDPKLSGKGQLTDSGSHFVALIFFLTNFTPEKIASFIDFRGEKVDMNSAFIVKFKEGAIGSFGILAFDPSFREGLFIWDDRNNVLKLSATENSYVQFKGEKEIKDIEIFEPEAKSPAEDLIECIKGRKQPHTDWEIVENVALLSDMVYKSYLENKILEI